MPQLLHLGGVNFICPGQLRSVAAKFGPPRMARNAPALAKEMLATGKSLAPRVGAGVAHRHKHAGAGQQINRGLRLRDSTWVKKNAASGGRRIAAHCAGTGEVACTLGYDAAGGAVRIASHVAAK